MEDHRGPQRRRRPPSRFASPAISTTSARQRLAFLVTGPEGHVVLDGGYPNTGPMIIASIAQLGFDIKDVKVLLNSIPRRDHAGGLAALQQASGAKLWASESSAGVIASGGDDPDIALPFRTLVQIGILGFPPARVDHRFKDGDTIRVGPIALTAHVTGGSTRGCTSWSFPVRDAERVLNVVSACPLEAAPLGMRYPEQGPTSSAACACSAAFPLTSG
jgi:metallo-beta-lactamase class B